jgi:hypothetical protein
MEYGATN